ncbi:MAG: alanine racemase [Lachnospiraceae bacterium]|nr:alanine racemase [Lachnospiraceae bacterium]
MSIYSRVYAAVDLDNIVHNMKEMIRVIGEDTNVIAVIKTDGYGHGAVPIARELEGLPRVWGYGVATVEEGEILRRNGIQKPILVLGATFLEQYEAMAAWDIRPTVFSLDMALEMEKAMEKTGKQLKIHVKIDTGLSRLGFQVTSEAADWIAQISSLPHIILEGVFTHFVKSDAADKTMAEDQMKQFHEMKEMLSARGASPKLYHASNSAGIIDLPWANLDLVRAGISLYGLWPSDEVQRENLTLRPALSLVSRIVFLKDLEAGRTVSYGATYTLKEPSRIATVPVGYGDGYPRSLSNKGYVLIHGKRAPICGRICMDQFMVDVTEIPEAALGDEAVLIGSSQGESITMEELGELSGRFHYEFACDLGKRIPRVYTKNGKVIGTRDYFGE